MKNVVKIFIENDEVYFETEDGNFYKGKTVEWVNYNRR